MIKKVFSEIKIFQIDKTFFEIRNLSNEKIINYISNCHRIKVKKYNEQNKELPKLEKDNTTYYSYTYNELLKDSYWKMFLPSEFTEKENFEVQQLSFVLFASIGKNLFAIVGGNGIRVIKKFINDRFGIELYEHLTIPREDIVISLTVRGVTGNLTEQKEIFRKEQSLLDSLELTDIPTKMTIYLRQELKDNYFDFLNFKKENSYLEIGSYFFLKAKVDFENLHFIFETLNLILEENEPTPLSSFIKIKDVNLIEENLEQILFENIKNETSDKFSASRGENPYKVDLDFVHPTKLQEFYECDKFELKAKRQKAPFAIITERNQIYNECLKFIYEKLDDLNDTEKLKNTIRGIRIIGYRNEIEKTQAMLLNHITTEIKYNGRPYFKIDNSWYKVENTFIEKINELCIDNYKKNRLFENILIKKWDSNIEDEDAYNKQYKHIENYFVFDKVLSDNIELCDIMYEDKDNIYLIHVKDGFDAKIRDLSNQLVLSSNRLWHDLNNYKKSNFLELLIERYNQNNLAQINIDELINKMKTKKEVIYVMAFRTKRKNLTLEERIKQSKSNIAKYATVQCVKDLTKYKMKIIDITEVE